MRYTLQVEEREAIRELGRRLIALGLGDLLASYGSEEVRIDTLRFDLPLLPMPIRVLAKLFVLGEPVKVTIAEALLSQEVITVLMHLNILHSHGDLLDLSPLRLVSHFGVWIFCEQPNVAAHLYYGNDSLALGRMLFPARGRVLDICAGVGTQGLLCALTADFVVAVEQQQAAVALFALNAVLNGVDEKIELRLGDLVEPVAGETFDRICCNPPLLPVPDSLPFPVVANGGPDGLSTVNRLIAALPGLLRDGGRCHIVGTLVGSGEGPDICALQKLVEEGGLDVILILPCRESLAPTARMLDSMALTASRYSGVDLETARRAFLDSFAAMGVDHLYSFLMAAMPARGRHKGRIEMTQHYLRGSSFWTV